MQWIIDTLNMDDSQNNYIGFLKPRYIQSLWFHLSKIWKVQTNLSENRLLSEWLNIGDRKGKGGINGGTGK